MEMRGAGWEALTCPLSFAAGRVGPAGSRERGEEGWGEVSGCGWERRGWESPASLSPPAAASISSACLSLDSPANLSSLEDLSSSEDLP